MSIIIRKPKKQIPKPEEQKPQEPPVKEEEIAKMLGLTPPNNKQKQAENKEDKQKAQS